MYGPFRFLPLRLTVSDTVIIRNVFKLTMTTINIFLTFDLSTLAFGWIFVHKS